jgi:ribosomal protein S18 acetylase RimI-like enzyme
VLITRAEAADAARVAELAARTFPLACPPDAPADDIEAHIALHLSEAAFAVHLADRQRVVLIAEGAGDGPGAVLAGYAMLVFGEPADAEVAAQLAACPTAELSKIYVDPAHHGGAVAAALMTAALAEAGRRGAASVWLGTNQENARAQRFYVKSGFARVGVKHFRLGTRVEDDYIYERPL